MENENDSFLSKFEWNNFNITALNILLSELSQNGEVFLVGIFDNQMRPIRNVSFVNTFRVNDMGLKVVPTKTKEMQMIGIDVFDNRDNNYTIFLGTRTNIDALRSIYTKIVPPFSEGGGVGSEIYNGGNIEDYYEMNIGLKERVRKIKTLIKNRELYDVKPSLFDDANDYFTLFNAGVLTKLDLREINKNNPKTFESFKNQNLLFENGIIDNRPSTLIKVEKSCDDVSSLLDISRDIRNDLIKNVLCGDVAELTDSWSYYYENPSDLVDNLNKENEQSVIDEISRITGLEKSLVEENGIKYYLDGDDENYDKDSFDNIIRVLASAQNSADNDDYYKYLYKEIENSLEELGEVHSLDDEGVKMTIDLSNRLTIDEIAESMDRYEFTDISDLFDELVSRGEIDLPNFSIDDRYSAYGSTEDFNAYVSDSDFEQGFKKGGSVGMQKLTDVGVLELLTIEQVEQNLGRKLHWWNDDVVNINGNQYKKVFLRPEYKRLYALGGKVNEENEDLDLSKDFAIRNLFYKYEKQYEDEYNEDNWIKFHYGSERKGGVKALKESLELIGDGEITDKGDKHFMYKEMLKNDSLILVVHASLKKSPYGGMEGYKYSLGVYRNNPRTQQIGGGYGASGIMSIEHTKLLSYDDYDIVHHNRIIISKVCNDIKKYAEKYF